jgi:hypothetical protein
MDFSDDPRLQEAMSSLIPAPTSPSYSPPTMVSIATDDDPLKVVVTDFQMRIGSMCIFMIKWALASIPAVIIITIIFAILFSILRAIIFHG